MDNKRKWIDRIKYYSTWIVGMIIIGVMAIPNLAIWIVFLTGLIFGPETAERVGRVLRGVIL